MATAASSSSSSSSSSLSSGMQSTPSSVGNVSSSTDTLRYLKELRRTSPHLMLQRTTYSSMLCSTLPEHWRSNKTLPTPFIVVFLEPIPDGTKVSVWAGNEENPNADMRNAVSETRHGVARFSDLRFVGRSGRGRMFHVTICLHTTPQQVGVVLRAIKVTIDGKRDPRPHTNRWTPSEIVPTTPSRRFNPCARPATVPKRSSIQSTAVSSTSSSGSAPPSAAAPIVSLPHHPRPLMPPSVSAAATALVAPLLTSISGGGGGGGSGGSSTSSQQHQSPLIMASRSPPPNPLNYLYFSILQSQPSIAAAMAAAAALQSSTPRVPPPAMSLPVLASAVTASDVAAQITKLADRRGPPIERDRNVENTAAAAAAATAVAATAASVLALASKPTSTTTPYCWRPF